MSGDEHWQSCQIGSCQRHKECMYVPCRNVRDNGGGMSGHTPGPWTVGSGNVNAEATVEAEYTQVCTCHHHCVGAIEKEMHANARLIAAAPDLLSALKHCVDVWSKLGGPANDWLHESRAAIAKAEGKP